jgi:chromosome partitioning protein
MHITTSLNEKGGVGKTTVTVTIAAGLAIHGYRVLVIDADSQGNATQAFGIKPYPGYYDLVQRDADFSDVVRVVAPERIVLPDEASALKGQVLVVGSNVETRHVANGEGSENPQILKERLDQLAEADVVDVVLIDTSPSPSMMHSLIYLATDSIIYPTRLESWAVSGLYRSVRNASNFAPFRAGLGLPPIVNLGIVPTMTKLRTTEHVENLKQLTEKFNQDAIWRDVPDRIIWAEAAAAQRSIFSYATGVPAANEAIKDAWRLVNMFAEKVVTHA